MSVATAGRRYNYKSSIYNFFDSLGLPENRQAQIPYPFCSFSNSHQE